MQAAEILEVVEHRLGDREASARVVTVLVDSGKFSSQAMYRIVPLAALRGRIQHCRLRYEAIRDLGLELIVVD